VLIFDIFLWWWLKPMKNDIMKKSLIVLTLIFLLIAGFNPLINANRVCINIENDICLKNSTLSFQNYEAEVPVWDIGDSWTYDVELDGSLNASTSFDGKVEYLVFRVVADTESSYKLEFNGQINGELSTESSIITGTLKDTFVEGDLSIEKSMLGIQQLDAQISGKIIITLIPIPLTINLTLNFNPAYNSLDYPISVGKQWIIISSNVKGNADISSILEGIAISTSVGGGNANCISIKSITVKAGTYDAYKIIGDGDISEMYYAEIAGNVIKVLASTYYYDEIILELVSTTYEYVDPGSPIKPDKPSGPAQGISDEEYIYTTSTIDPNGDHVYYKWDWGDVVSDWDGFYNSGETINASHIWSTQGIYIVKVKAKDEQSHESKWSDPLVVTIPKNKPYFYRPILYFFENHPLIYKLLQRFLQL
jgi:hypothetical protein